MKQFSWSLILLILSATALAEPEGLKIKDVWARETPAGTAQSAVYMILDNQSNQEYVLQGVKTSLTKQAMLHTHVNENGVMKMRHISEMRIPAKQKLKLEPGGHHIMLMGLQKPVTVNSKVSIQLLFANGETLDLKVPVKRQ